MRVTSSISCISSRSTEATMMRADAAPIAPASWRSTNETTAKSAGALRSRRRACSCSNCAKAASARCSPRKRESRSHRSSTLARPCHVRPATAESLKTSANCTAWLRSSTDCEVNTRDPHQKADIGDHGPDGGMRDRIEPVQAKQRVGFEQRDAERTVLGPACARSSPIARATGSSRV